MKVVMASPSAKRRYIAERLNPEKAEKPFENFCEIRLTT